MKKGGVFIAILVALVIIILVATNRVPDVSQDVEDPAGLDISTEEVQYFEDSIGYLAKPVEEGVYPGLILIHEWWGLTPDIKETADRFAAQGYVALAVDLYAGEATDDPSVARVLATAVREDMDGAFTNLEGAVQFLESQSNVQNDKLASVGWCFGGGWSYEMAKNDLGIESSVIYYGRFNPEDDLSKMRATVLGHFGEDDTSILVDDVEEFRATLMTLSGEHQIFIYPNSGHAFANEGRPSYVPESAMLAWERTLEFLNEELK